MTCTICQPRPFIGDADVYPQIRVVRGIDAGTPIGTAMDYSPFDEPSGHHLHIGVVNRPIVDDGLLAPAYKDFGWAIEDYIEEMPGAVERAAATGVGLGFIDPKGVLPSP